VCEGGRETWEGGKKEGFDCTVTNIHNLRQGWLAF
jgi:hypothetical protein